MNEKTGKALRYTLSFLLAGVLVWLACRGIEWKAFWLGLRSTRWGFIVLFFAASIAALALRAARWKQMLRPLDPGTRFRTAWDAANVGNLTNVLFPGAGELVRSGIVARKDLPFERVFGTAVMERIWDFAAVGVIFVLAAVLGRDIFGDFFAVNIWAPLTTRRSLLVLLVILLLVFAAAVWAVFRYRERVPLLGRIAARFAGFGDGFVSFFKMERKGVFFIYTALIWTMYLLMSWFVLKAIPELSGLGASDALFLSAVGNIASIIPVPGGIGAYHYLLRLTIVSIYGAAEESGLLFATLSHELHALLVIVLGLVSYGRTTLRSPAKNDVLHAD